MVVYPCVIFKLLLRMSVRFPTMHTRIVIRIGKLFDSPFLQKVKGKTLRGQNYSFYQYKRGFRCYFHDFADYIFLFDFSQKWQIKLSSKSSREDMCRLPTSFLLNIQSRVKQEVDMPQIQNCVTRYSSPY